jgi:hypothetical protein
MVPTPYLRGERCTHMSATDPLPVWAQRLTELRRARSWVDGRCPFPSGETRGHRDVSRSDLVAFSKHPANS